MISGFITLWISVYCWYVRLLMSGTNHFISWLLLIQFVCIFVYILINVWLSAGEVIFCVILLVMHFITLWSVWNDDSCLHVCWLPLVSVGGCLTTAMLKLNSGDSAIVECFYTMTACWSVLSCWFLDVRYCVYICVGVCMCVCACVCVCQLDFYSQNVGNFNCKCCPVRTLLLVLGAFFFAVVYWICACVVCSLVCYLVG